MAFQTLLREINLHHLSEAWSPNLGERICAFETEVDATFSVYYIPLCIIYWTIFGQPGEPRKRLTVMTSWDMYGRA